MPYCVLFNTLSIINALELVKFMPKPTQKIKLL